MLGWQQLADYLLRAALVTNFLYCFGTELGEFTYAGSFNDAASLVIETIPIQ